MPEQKLFIFCKGDINNDVTKVALCFAKEI